ncbi:MAG: hypothetical protein ACK57N_04025 [Planctomycetia bacterium]
MQVGIVLVALYAAVLVDADPGLRLRVRAAGHGHAARRFGDESALRVAGESAVRSANGEVAEGAAQSRAEVAPRGARGHRGQSRVRLRGHADSVPGVGRGGDAVQQDAARGVQVEVDSGESVVPRRQAARHDARVPVRERFVVDVDLEAVQGVADEVVVQELERETASRPAGARRSRQLRVQALLRVAREAAAANDQRDGRAGRRVQPAQRGAFRAVVVEVAAFEHEVEAAIDRQALVDRAARRASGQHDFGLRRVRSRTQAEAAHAAFDLDAAGLQVASRGLQPGAGRRQPGQLESVDRGERAFLAGT